MAEMARTIDEVMAKADADLDKLRALFLELLRQRNDANERADRMQRESTAELLKHRDEKAGMLQKIQDQKNLIHGLNTRHLEDVTLAGAKDRRIGELEGALKDAVAILDRRRRGFDPGVSIGDLTAQVVDRADAALAGKGVSCGE